MYQEGSPFWKKMAIFIFTALLPLLAMISSIKEGFDIKIPHLNGPCYMKPGNINLGVIISYSARGTESYCSSNLQSKWGTQYAEVLKYAIGMINRREDILPNVTLGYIMTDACDRDLVALGRSVSFIPTQGNEEVLDSTNRFPVGFTENCSEAVKFYHIAGVV